MEDGKILPRCGRSRNVSESSWAIPPACMEASKKRPSTVSLTIWFTSRGPGPAMTWKTTTCIRTRRLCALRPSSYTLAATRCILITTKSTVYKSRTEIRSIPRLFVDYWKACKTPNDLTEPKKAWIVRDTFFFVWDAFDPSHLLPVPIRTRKTCPWK